MKLVKTADMKEKGADPYDIKQQDSKDMIDHDRIYFHIYT
ncbi:tubulin-specific chaperone A-like isoform 2 [Corchorus olitorius]|uniref:Tubulin-specific chaperone A-like isoform 2 n=1 Tax=Corchorus olitorius TaxID=93759 RepID=A0A1R3IK92_9ROSI|nr:tubulin-specific chaperone A-like isoform 2 [Corchorus olitorius]